MITTIFMSQAWLNSFVLPFVLSVCLRLRSRVNQALFWRSLCPFVITPLLKIFLRPREDFHYTNQPASRKQPLKGAYSPYCASVGINSVNVEKKAKVWEAQVIVSRVISRSSPLMFMLVFTYELGLNPLTPSMQCIAHQKKKIYRLLHGWSEGTTFI